MYYTVQKWVTGSFEYCANILCVSIRFAKTNVNATWKKFPFLEICDNIFVRIVCWIEHNSKIIERITWYGTINSKKHFPLERQFNIALSDATMHRFVTFLQCSKQIFWRVYWVEQNLLKALTAEDKFVNERKSLGIYMIDAQLWNLNWRFNRN